MSAIAKWQPVESGAPKQGMVTSVTRKFVGDFELRELLPSLLESQLDSIVNKYYHTERAGTVASQATKSEGVELP
jgi:hypothetical protein